MKELSHDKLELFSNIPRWIVIIMDVIIIITSLILAYFIRFDFFNDYDQFLKEWNNVKNALPFIILIQPFVFYLFKIHKGLIRHTSLEDVKRIFFATLASTIILYFTGLFRYIIFDSRFLLPTSVLIINFSLSLILLLGFRFSVKIIYYEIKKPKAESDKINILIYGAGVSGLITKRSIEKDPLINSRVIGFIDDNKRLNGKRLEGTPIHHTSKLDTVLKKTPFQELIIAIQNPNTKNTTHVVDLCLERKINVRQIPSFKKWINGEFSLKQIRKLNINDLLGREKIQLDEGEIHNRIKDKVVLITGAAGSIGSEISRQVVQYQPKKVILLDQWETGLYDFHNELITDDTAENLEVVIGDVRDFHRMKRLFIKLQPSIVFHAAAYKHVPLMEENPSESIKTNVLGTKNIADLSDQFGVEQMVFISTDKAVNPTNVMGASKRIAEMYVQYKNTKSTTQYVTTRFGNVLGSNGSVIPLFQRQIAKGGPLTVTDENVTRFFMTIPEACQLVLEAGSMGNGGEIFVFDMGESVKIIDLAKKMIRLSGLEIGKDIEIKITGLRPGEKLYEELLSSEENTIPTHHPQILKAKCNVAADKIEKDIDFLLNLFDQQNNDDIVKKMKQIVPEFKSNNSSYIKFDK